MLVFSDILWKMLQRLETTEADRVTSAKEVAGNDMVEVLRLTFPIVLQVQMNVLDELGIAKGKEGKPTKNISQRTENGWMRGGLLKQFKTQSICSTRFEGVPPHCKQLLPPRRGS